MGIVNGFGNIGNMCVDDDYTLAVFILLNSTYRIGSFVWKASWGPSYHNSMIITTIALVVASMLAFSAYYNLLQAVHSADPSWKICAAYR